MAKNHFPMALFLYQWLFVRLLAFGLSFHPFYVSVTELEYSSKDKELGVAGKFFTDDLEETLKNFSKQKVDLVNGDKTASAKFITDYVNTHLKIKIDGNPIALKYLGFENDREATWCYFSATGISSFKTIEISNDLLYDFKKEQVNLVHIIVDGNRRSNRLVYPDNAVKLEF